MKRTLALAAALVLMLSAALLRAGDTPQERYVLRYAQIAVQEMYRSGVPASITLAQGILESRYGLSPLATEGHNHFGIKCHKDWKGKSMKVDDDAPGECFRVYDEDEESFRDHSDFLRYRDRYKFLFDYPVTDYKAWADGLKKAGYATDPAYPSKLIRYIEDYGLARYDTMKPSDFDAEEAPQEPDEEVVAREDAPRKAAQKQPQKQSKGAKKTRDAEEREPEVLPESPAQMEEAVKVSEKEQKETFHFAMTRPVYKQNGVPFIYSREGETFASIAEDNNLFLKEILRINDLSSDERLAPGTMVYLQMKKNQTRKGLDKYIVGEDGESLRDICQRFGVRMASISKLNGFTPDHVLREGDTILLRK